MGGGGGGSIGLFAFKLLSSPAAHHSELPIPVTPILFKFDSRTKYDIGVKPMAFGRGRVWGMGYC